MKTRWVAAAGVWLVLVLAGASYLMIYETTPGTEEKTPRTWPAASPLALAPNRPTLVMFAHPRCPCTRASIGELAVLMAQCQGKVAAHVLFLRPEGAEGWAETDLWRSAAAIPGVTVQWDEAGRAARDFGAATSGSVVLYDTKGALLFRGGITDARGHSGDNDGREGIVALLGHKETRNVITPVYGCSLVSSGSAALATTCPR